jgi:UDP-glucose 4-epimerase
VSTTIANDRSVGKGRLLALTGGSGFIGRRLADHARAAGYRLRRFGRTPSTGDRNECAAFDLAGPSLDPELLRGCEVLIHLAAHIPRDHGDADEAERCWRINALGTSRLINSAIRGGVRHIIQTTSANAYAPSMIPPDEAAALFPQSRSYYLGSKILQEIYAVEACSRAGVRLTTLRLGSVYGAGQTSGAVGAMVSAAMTRGAVRVADAGRFGADLVAVDDIVAAAMLILTKEVSGPVNVGSGVRTTMATLAALIASQTGARIVKERGRDGPDDFGFPALNIMRLTELGYRPRQIEDGIAAMLWQPRAG